MIKVLITGITGQDGSYLAEFLLEKGFEVHGIVRRIALEDPDHRLNRVKHILDEISLHAGSLESFPSLLQIVQSVQPDECYHLAAQSFVSISFDDEYETMNTNINGTHNLLSVIKTVCPECKFYFAATSEMFGTPTTFPQNEDTQFRPRSVYGISKVAGFELTRNYRETYDLFACSGILFNHESPRRGYEFVTRKISSTAAKIKLGKAKEIRLGNIDAKRDWGFAKDYVKAMVLMLNHQIPDDYVISSGSLHSVREFLEVAFNCLNLSYEDYLKIDDRFYRPDEKHILTGNSTKAKKTLGWKSTISFEQLVEMMVQADYDQQKHPVT